KVRVAQLRRHGASRPSGVTEVLREPLRHPAQLCVQLRAVGEVAFERVFDADRDALRLLVESARVDAAGALLQHAPDTPRQEAPELSLRERGERADRLDAGGDEALLGLRPDAREPSDVERREEARLVALGNDRKAARLPVVAADLRHDLRRRDPDCTGEARRSPDGGLHRLGDLAGLEKRRGYLADIEVALVEPRLLDGGHDAAHGLPDVLRVFAVQRVARADEDHPGAAPQRLRTAHGGVDAELPGLVVRGGNDASTVWIAAHDERLRPKARVFELLDRGEEGVEIEVGDDHARKPRHRTFGHMPCRPLTRYTCARGPTRAGVFTHHPLRSMLLRESETVCADSAAKNRCQGSTHSSLRMIGTAVPPASTPSTSTSGPPIMKSVCTLDVFAAPSGSSNSAFRVKARPAPYAMWQVAFSSKRVSKNVTPS